MVHVDNELLFFSKGMRLLVEWVEIEIILCEVIKIQKKTCRNDSVCSLSCVDANFHPFNIYV